MRIPKGKFYDLSARVFTEADFSLAGAIILATLHEVS